MARGRKSTVVKVLTRRDKDLLLQLARTGIGNTQQAQKFCGLTEERVKKLEKSGYIKSSVHVVRGSNNRILQLDKKGKEYCRQEEGITTFCKAQTNHLEHDIKLTEIYYSLDKDVRETWRCELELITDIYKSNPEMIGKLDNCVDATIEVQGETIAIESIGASYTKKDIEVKNEVASKLLGCSRMESV